MRTYVVFYKEHSAAEIMMTEVQAKNKVEAYDKAVFEELAEVPYSAWVAAMATRKGYHRFNTFEGKPY